MDKSTHFKFLHELRIVIVFVVFFFVAVMTVVIIIYHMVVWMRMMMVVGIRMMMSFVNVIVVIMMFGTVFCNVVANTIENIERQIATNSSIYEILEAFKRYAINDMDGNVFRCSERSSAC